MEETIQLTTDELDLLGELSFWERIYEIALKYQGAHPEHIADLAIRRRRERLVDVMATKAVKEDK